MYKHGCSRNFNLNVAILVLCVGPGLGDLMLTLINRTYMSVILPSFDFKDSSNFARTTYSEK